MDRRRRKGLPSAQKEESWRRWRAVSPVRRAVRSSGRRLTWILALLALQLACPPHEARAETLGPIRRVISFGDSLSDGGSYWFRFTTNPCLTFAQYLALHYGQMPLPNEHLDDYRNVYKGHPGIPGPGGLNYAEGGAKANSAYSVDSTNPEGVPISLTVQLHHYLKQHHVFAAGDLVTLFIGINDAARGPYVVTTNSSNVLPIAKSSTARRSRSQASVPGASSAASPARRQQCFNFLPLRHGQGSLRPGVVMAGGLFFVVPKRSSLFRGRPKRRALGASVHLPPK